MMSPYYNFVFLIIKYEKKKITFEYLSVYIRKFTNFKGPDKWRFNQTTQGI